MTKPLLQGHQPIETGYILVVDDMADNCFLLKAILESEGYTVDIAHNGTVALAKAEASPPKERGLNNL
ncbi:response regulator [Stenomitos frigidus]|nr:response regulator [Stenomitos frigidus]